MQTRLLALALALAACSGDGVDTGTSDTDSGVLTDSGGGDGGDSGVDPDTVALGGACPLESKFGAFAASVYMDQGYSIVDGSVADGVVPITILEEISVEGECRVMRRNNPFCDPGCDSDETCDFDGTCIPYPDDQDLGTVTIDGLLAEVSMDPVTPGYTYFNTSLPHPGFDAGTLLTLQTAGGAWDPVTMYGVGVEPMELIDTEWIVSEGSDLTIRWNAPTDTTSRAHAYMTLNVDQHGASPLNVWCEFDDDGEGTVPSNVIDALISAGVTGFPTGILTRRTVDSTTLSDGVGCMEFVVSSPRNASVDVDGFTPCYSDDDCPDGQECNELLQVCE